MPLRPCTLLFYKYSFSFTGLLPTVALAMGPNTTSYVDTELVGLPGNLWVIMAAEPGSGKSVAFRPACKLGIERIEALFNQVISGQVKLPTLSDYARKSQHFASFVLTLHILKSLFWKYIN